MFKELAAGALVIMHNFQAAGRKEVVKSKCRIPLSDEPETFLEAHHYYCIYTHSTYILLTGIYLVTWQYLLV